VIYMADIKKSLKEVVEKTSKTLELPKEQIEKITKVEEELKKASTTIRVGKA
jgi:uncharacterized protein YoxC